MPRRSKVPPSAGEYEHAPIHVARLYDASKILARFESIEETLPLVLELASDALDLRLVIVVHGPGPRPRTFVWYSSDVSPGELEESQATARRQYAYLATFAPSPEWVTAGDGVNGSRSWALDSMGASRGPALTRITLPLSIDRARVVGVLGVECRSLLDEIGLAFLNALAHQIAVALDRHDAGRREVLQREQAESAQLAAQNAVKARDAFISVASHELRGPLGALTIQLGLLERLVAVGTDPRLPPKLTFLKRQVARMRSLVDKLLDVSRVTSGHLELQLEPVDLRDVVQEVVARAHDDIEHAGSTVVLAAPSPAVGNWDRMRLDQVVTNLLSNAIKYGRGKPIEISLESGEKTTRLAVRDHGVGMSPDDQAKVFRQFERVGDTSRHGGLGLGLWIVHQIVEAMSGTVRIESRLGEGSTLTVELPRTHESLEAA